MLLRISNTPRDYAWGSRNALAELEGRVPSGGPEAEVWFGDHPANPSVLVQDSGRAVDEWIATDGPAHGVHGPLPFLLKLLAAASPLSIQAHPSKAQAGEGFAREESAGVPRDAPSRNYRDDNHKPEVIVALSDVFEALAGFRPIDDARRLVAALGTQDRGVDALRAHLAGEDAEGAVRECVAWLLSPDAAEATRDIIAAVRDAASRPHGHAAEFADDLAAVARIADAYPGDPGVVVALLLNRVSLERGAALFVPAGMPHAYLEGLGVEIMAASDNVLRGGLTPKHVDVGELLRVLVTTTGPAIALTPVDAAPGLQIFAPPIDDFALARVRIGGEATEVEVPLNGTSIALATAGAIMLHGRGGDIVLEPGMACLVTPDESPLRVSGHGELFVAQPAS